MQFSVHFVAAVFPSSPNLDTRSLSCVLAKYLLKIFGKPLSCSCATDVIAPAQTALPCPLGWDVGSFPVCQKLKDQLSFQISYWYRQEECFW